MSAQTRFSSEDEQEQLLKAYNGRRRVFMIFYPASVVVSLVTMISVNGGFSKVGTPDGWYFFLAVLVGASPLVYWGYRHYEKRIAPLRRDAQEGVLALVPVVITRKCYNSHTGQYFIRFNDATHREVDREFYHRCKPGDSLEIPKGPRSGFVFEA